MATPRGCFYSLVGIVSLGIVIFLWFSNLYPSEKISRGFIQKPLEMFRPHSRYADSAVSFPALASTNAAGINFSSIGRYSCPQQQDRPAPRYLSVPRPFRPTTSEDERLLLLLTLQTLVRSLESRGLTYFLYGGSLLGSYRHHGFIPWDDDIDVMFNSSQKTEVLQALCNVSNFQLHISKTWSWKFFWRSPEKRPTKKYLWPYIDMFFFDENATHIWDALPAYKNKFVFPKWAVFPLVRRPFEGAWLLAPQHTGIVLENYHDGWCEYKRLCHKTGSVTDKVDHRLSCQTLRPFFPFVERSKPRRGVLRETLNLGDHVIHMLDLPEPTRTSSG